MYRLHFVRYMRRRLEKQRFTFGIKQSLNLQMGIVIVQNRQTYVVAA